MAVADTKHAAVVALDLGVELPRVLGRVEAWPAASDAGLET